MTKDDDDLPSFVLPTAQQRAENDAHMTDLNQPFPWVMTFFAALRGELDGVVHWENFMTIDSLESGAWGDFAWARERVTGLGMTSKAEFDRRPGYEIAYVRCPVEGQFEQEMIAIRPVPFEAVYATLIREPGDHWRVHALGGRWNPDGR